MTFEVGRLSAALTLDGVNEFHRGLDEAGRKLDSVGQKGSSFGRLGTEAFKATAGATVALTAAATGYLAVLTKQGVAYNSLQQNSRAALTVLLGGAEKANVQMDKLDAFARNSPFSKSVFIQAQQQLLGFGMEAAKVVPTLDAVQQSVAAMGGSNEQISEVVNILANVNSTGKITAETFNQLGYRGIDAADLLGKKWGKTSAEIREAVTKGEVDGKEAIDALVDSMQNRFGGAADNVKQQWSGAVDRIKAAQRDLGAHIAEPFVSAQGGGMAVTWGNQVANVLRAIEKQAVPVMGILTQRGMPFFASLGQGLDTAQAAIQRWNPTTLEASLNKMAGHAPGIAALAGTILALGANVGPLGKMLSTLGLTVNPVLAAFVGLAAASPELRDALGQLLAAGKPLLPMVGDLARVLSGSLNSALPLVSGGIELLTSVLRPVIGLIEQIPTPVLAGALAFLGMQQALKQASGPIEAVSGALQQLGERAAVQAALGQTSAGIGALSAASMSAKGTVTQLGTSLKTAFIGNPVGLALTAVTALVSMWAMANATAQQKVEEHKSRVADLKDTLNATTGEITDATRAQQVQNLEGTRAAELAQEMGIAYSDVQQALLGNATAQDRVNSAMKKHWEENAVTLNESDDALNSWSASAVNARNRNAELTEIMEQQKASIEDAIVAKQEAIQADREAAAAMGDAALSNQRFNDALGVARDVTADAETRVRALKQALDELKGGAISAEEAEKRLSETNLTLAEGLAQAGESGEKLWQSTIDGAGAIDLGTRNGLAFADAMGRSRDAMLDAARAASDQALANGDVAGAAAAAKAAGEEYLVTLQQTMTDAGLTADQINGLVGKYLDVPSVVATLITDNGSISEVDQQVLALASQIRATPDKTVTIREPLSPAVIQRLETLRATVKNLPDGSVQITQTGADIVEGVLQSLTVPRTATVHIATGPGGAGGITKADGGVVQRSGSSWRDMRSFANGGSFPTGIYAGGPPLIKFAEPETGWEAFISGRPGQEARNARIAMDALTRLGFPVVPVSALGGTRAFANGGTVGARPSTPSAPTAPQRVERRMRTAPLVGSVHLGEGATKNDLRELEETIARLERRN